MLKQITFKGKAMKLVGRTIKEGKPAPDFRAVSPDGKDVSLADFNGKVKLINSYISLDTPVCDLQVKEFNKRATQLSAEVAVVGISRDLPFAQKRFCDANNIGNITTLSDYKYWSFGINYGMIIKEMNLLTRAVVIIDKTDVIRYIQYVDEITNQPDYDAALTGLTAILKNPTSLIPEALSRHCTPCEKGTPPMDSAKVQKFLAEYPNWELFEENKIKQDFKFKDFVDAMFFINIIAEIAEEQGHHPTIDVTYNKVRIILYTHAANGLTKNDFILAKMIDEIGGD